MIGLLKQLLPDRSVPLPVLFGPFRGARIRMNPRYSLRKILGVYEHELNPWLNAVLPHVDTVLDVGANDGYFTFGCAAVLERRQRSATIVAFEPQLQHVRQLQASLQDQSYEWVSVRLRHSMVGKAPQPGVSTLDDFEPSTFGPALIKIDVEGAEMEVIEGASTWLKPTNYYLIEVHRREYIKELQERCAFFGIILRQVDQNPLPLLGREPRNTANWWLVSEIGCHSSPITL